MTELQGGNNEAACTCIEEIISSDSSSDSDSGSGSDDESSATSSCRSRSSSKSSDSSESLPPARRDDCHCPVDVVHLQETNKNNDKTNDSARDSDSPAAAALQDWTKRVPIGLGLCPWAIQSDRRKRIQYVTCEGIDITSITNAIVREANTLVADDDGVPEWSTTLVVCPNIAAWNDDFEVFDVFVKNFWKTTSTAATHQEDKATDDHVTTTTCLEQQITLVAFHPQFLRWRGLAAGIDVGSVVHCHYGMAGFQKSQTTIPATILETHSPMFGQRKAKVRFHDDNACNNGNNYIQRKEQYVPNDWIVLPPKDGDNNDNNTDADHPTTSAYSDSSLGPPLPDNAMHRAPHPTIHLIRNQDLGILTAREVSRVKRINAKRIMALGWEGIQRRTQRLENLHVQGTSTTKR
mgnify:CR=1 FL=1